MLPPSTVHRRPAASDPTNCECLVNFPSFSVSTKWIDYGLDGVLFCWTVVRSNEKNPFWMKMILFCSLYLSSETFSSSRKGITQEQQGVRICTVVQMGPRLSFLACTARVLLRDMTRPHVNIFKLVVLFCYHVRLHSSIRNLIPCTCSLHLK
jgi:hypothetical protein